jgi:catechol 2,3-dioxygenase-like lactoylglutathione lyase family enzyme
MLLIKNVQVWTLDQDEALEFWTTKVGFELREDVTYPEMGDFRWLTVGVPGHENPEIVLMAIPPEPMFPAETVEAITNLLAGGFSGGVFMVTDDAVKFHEQLVANGVEITDAPQERPYGIDFGFRDPSGNHFRVTQRTDL